jgi:hypothetical protein
MTKVLRIILVIALNASILHGEDFSLTYLDATPITLHTTLTYEGKGERLMATAKNESGAAIQHAKICILASAFQKECLLELWNTAPWAPGAELSWNITTAKKVATLSHSASIEELESVKAAEVAPPLAPVISRSTAPAPPAAPPPPAIEYSSPGLPTGPMLTLQDGTPLRMRLTRNLSYSEAEPNDRVDFEVLDEVRVGGALAIASGAIAVATVTDSEAKRSMGRAGRLDVTLDYVRSVSGEKIRLRGVQDTKGGGHTGAMTGVMVATAVVFWPAAPLFLFMKGKDVRIPQGHEVTVYVNGDQQVRAMAAAPLAPAAVEKIEKPAPRRANTGKPMTNEDVLTLKAAGFGEEFIITKIKASASSFNLDTPDLVKLKQAGLGVCRRYAVAPAGSNRANWMADSWS